MTCSPLGVEEPIWFILAGFCFWHERIIAEEPRVWGSLYSFWAISW